MRKFPCVVLLFIELSKYLLDCFSRKGKGKEGDGGGKLGGMHCIGLVSDLKHRFLKETWHRQHNKEA